MFFLLTPRKNFLKEIVKQYPTVNEEELKELIKIKDSEITLSKIVTHDGADVVVYLVDKIPYFFKLDKDEQLMPTGKVKLLSIKTDIIFRI